MEFVAWPKIPRLKRTVTITEKIDGTNGCVVVSSEGDIYTQSRNRILGDGNDNAGFNVWAQANSIELASILGPGRWYGEWWGRGIQRGYGLDEKRFSLFDIRRNDIAEGRGSHLGLYVVPLLDTHTMSDHVIDNALDRLREHGSVAAPGFMQPEGVVVRHSQSGQMYKVLLVGDNISKTEAGVS